MPTCYSSVKAIVACAICCFPAHAGATSLPICPKSIADTSVKLEPVPTGWTAYIASPLYLNSAAPIDGPPQRKGELVPTAQRKAKGQTIFVYQLEGAFPDGKWLQCGYGEHGQVTLSKRIDDSVGRCEVSYRQGSKAGQNEISIVCR